MKALPRRKGNTARTGYTYVTEGLNESPSQKEGKFYASYGVQSPAPGLNESPSQKEGKLTIKNLTLCWTGLNESPSQKEGK